MTDRAGADPTPRTRAGLESSAAGAPQGAAAGQFWQPRPHAKQVPPAQLA